MPEPQLLKVYANPFCAAPDHEGRACGAVPYETPTDDDGKFLPVQMPPIGATRISTPKKRGKKGKPQPGTKLHVVVKSSRVSGSEQDADYDDEFEFHTDAVLVEDTPYYRYLLENHGRHGPALLPADEATTKAVFGEKRPHRDPLMRLHQFACERKLYPRLVHNELTEKASRAAHVERCAKLGKNTDEVSFVRNAEAEWHAFVGAEVVEARAEHEAREAEAMKKITGESVAPPTT